VPTIPLSPLSTNLNVDADLAGLTIACSHCGKAVLLWLDYDGNEKRPRG